MRGTRQEFNGYCAGVDCGGCHVFPLFRPVGDCSPSHATSWEPIHMPGPANQIPSPGTGGLEWGQARRFKCGFSIQKVMYGQPDVPRRKGTRTQLDR